MVEQAPSDDLYEQPLHPYTIALMSAIPIRTRTSRTAASGSCSGAICPARPIRRAGCRFHTRCPFRQPTRCDTEEPQLRVIETAAAGRKVACHYAEQILTGEIAVRDPGLVIEPTIAS